MTIPTRSLLGLLLLLCAGGVRASGYNFGTQSISAMSTADASAAEAADAGTIYYNPAGLTHLDGGQISANLVIAKPNVRYHDARAFYPSGSVREVAGSGSGTINDDWTPVPHLYLSYPLTAQITAGLGIYVPFGSGTEYAADSVTRYTINRTELKTFALNPALAFKIHPNHSLGIGLIAQYADARLYKYANFAPALSAYGIHNGQADGRARIKADDWGFGFNFGWMWDVNEQTRLGLSYRSAVKHELAGEAHWDLHGPAFAHPAYGGAFSQGIRQRGYAQSEGVGAAITTPESLSLHGMWRPNADTALFANITRARHSRFNDLQIAFANPKHTAYGLSDTSLILPQWRDTWRIGIGGSYQISPPLQLRAGISWDQSPITSADKRLVTMPDNDRLWFSFGAKYDFSPHSSLNLEYSYLYVKDSEAAFSGCAVSPCVDSYVSGNAKFKADSHFFGLQYTHRF